MIVLCNEKHPLPRQRLFTPYSRANTHTTPPHGTATPSGIIPAIILPGPAPTPTRASYAPHALLHPTPQYANIPTGQHTHRVAPLPQQSPKDKSPMTKGWQKISTNRLFDTWRNPTTGRVIHKMKRVSSDCPIPQAFRRPNLLSAVSEYMPTATTSERIAVYRQWKAWARMDGLSILATSR